jgi:hypothetical protein
MANSYKNKWAAAWQNKAFKKLFIVGIALLVLALGMLPVYFQAIQKREGPVLHDWLLNQLPAMDVSVWVFVIIWSITALSIVRAVQVPQLFITVIWVYLIVTLSRMVSIWLVPLNPPPNLIALTDPISNSFYGKSFITKDLFYSGHTSTLFMLYLCLRRRMDKFFALLGTILVASLLLIQHVHYSIDVILAPLFTLFCYRLAMFITNKARD